MTSGAGLPHHSPFSACGSHGPEKFRVLARAKVVVNVVRRPVLSLAVLLALAGCADPPGLKKPLPLDYQEQSHAQDVYRRIGPQMAKYDGVVGSFLTQTNNPRRIVVVVKDKTTRDQMRMLFGKENDGVKIRYEISDKGFDANAGIEAVEKVDLPVTWWDKVVFYLKNFANRVLPADMAPDDDGPAGAPPKLPPPDANPKEDSPKDPNLKTTWAGGPG